MGKFFTVHGRGPPSSDELEFDFVTALQDKRVTRRVHFVDKILP